MVYSSSQMQAEDVCDADPLAFDAREDLMVTRERYYSRVDCGAELSRMVVALAWSYRGPPASERMHTLGSLIARR